MEKNEDDNGQINNDEPKKKPGLQPFEYVIIGSIIYMAYAIYMSSLPHDGNWPYPHIYRTKSEIKAIGKILDEYKYDHDKYPGDHIPISADDLGNKRIDLSKTPQGLNSLTTPIAYSDWLPLDVFSPGGLERLHLGSGSDTSLPNKSSNNSFIILSRGPDRDINTMRIRRFPWTTDVRIYDPTNGIESSGDIILIGGDYTAGTFTIEGEPWQHYLGSN
jgi:hypothetical protein